MDPVRHVTQGIQGAGCMWCAASPAQCQGHWIRTGPGTSKCFRLTLCSLQNRSSWHVAGSIPPMPVPCAVYTADWCVLWVACGLDLVPWALHKGLVPVWPGQDEFDTPESILEERVPPGGQKNTSCTILNSSCTSGCARSQGQASGCREPAATVPNDGAETTQAGSVSRS